MSQFYKLKLYRALNKTVIQSFIFSRYFSSERLAEPFLGSNIKKNEVQKTVWFHAASAGELEALYPIILESAQEGWELVVTAFSESAANTLKLLKEELKQFSVIVHHLGYSPLEGAWGEALAAYSPRVFITSKYEAWPELWASLALAHIPLMVIGAKKRTSYHVAKKICSFLGVDLPQMILLTVDQDDEVSLQKLFPKSKIKTVGEPRWDRVAQRIQKGNDRARFLIQAFVGVKRPWLVMGQIWKEDLDLWRDILPNVHGTVWIIPHKVDSHNLYTIESVLQQMDIKVLRTSTLAPNVQLKPKTVILVDEIGVLAELYESADWVYVGGGFSHGVHSTIEPALRGVPIAAGPKGADRFNEIEQLSKTGQLSLVHNSSELRKWIEEVQKNLSIENRNRWQSQAKERLGATRKIIRILNELQTC